MDIFGVANNYKEKINRINPYILPNTRKVMSIWLTLLNSLKPSEITFHNLYKIIYKYGDPKKCLHDQTENTLRCKTSVETCRRSHPVFQFSDLTEIMTFAILMRDPIPKNYGSGNQECGEFNWNYLFVSKRGDLTHLYFILNRKRKIEFPWDDFFVIKTALDNTKKLVSNVKPNEFVQRSIRWFMESIYPELQSKLKEMVEDFILFNLDEYIFMEIGGYSISNEQWDNHIFKLFSKVNDEKEMGLYTKRLQEFIKRGIIDLGNRKDPRCTPYLVECIDRSMLTAAERLLQFGASPHMKDALGINLYKCIETGKWWTLKFIGGSERIETNIRTENIREDTLNLIKKFSNIWHPRRHLDFPTSFRRRVFEFLLVNNRLGGWRLSRDVLGVVFQHLAILENTLACETIPMFKANLIQIYGLSYTIEDFKYYSKKFGSQQNIHSRTLGAQILINNAIEGMKEDDIENINRKIEEYIEKHRNTSKTILACRANRRGAKHIIDTNLQLQCAVLKFMPMKILKQYLTAFEEERKPSRKKIKL